MDKEAFIGDSMYHSINHKNQFSYDRLEEEETLSGSENFIGTQSDDLKQTANFSAARLAIYVRGGVGEAGQVLTNNGDGTWSFR